MRLHEILVVCAGFCSFTCHAGEPSPKKAIEGDARGFLLTVDLQRTSTKDALQQEIIVQEGESFHVSTQVGDTRWTVSGDVYPVVDGHLPVLIRARWYKSARAHSTLATPMLVKLGGKATRRVGTLSGPGLSLAVRKLSEADELPKNDVMEKELRQMIEELREGRNSGVGE